MAVSDEMRFGGRFLPGASTRRSRSPDLCRLYRFRDEPEIVWSIACESPGRAAGASAWTQYIPTSVRFAAQDRPIGGFFGLSVTELPFERIEGGSAGRGRLDSPGAASSSWYFTESGSFRVLREGPDFRRIAPRTRGAGQPGSADQSGGSRGVPARSSRGSAVCGDGPAPRTGAPAAQADQR
jgi:hypothetical protein